MNIQEDYVSFETAKLLKDKGLDEDILTYRDDFIQHGNIVIPLQECLSKDRIKTPTLQMTMKWLREEYNLWIDIDLLTGYKWTWSIWFMNDPHKKMGESLQSISTYEQACEAAIKYCLENLI